MGYSSCHCVQQLAVHNLEFVKPVVSAPAAADASRMNALTGSPLTTEGGKADGSGLLKHQGYILLVPQGTGDVKQGQVGGTEHLTHLAALGIM